MVQVMGDAGCWILLGLSLLPIAVLGKWPPRGGQILPPSGSAAGAVGEEQGAGGAK